MNFYNLKHKEEQLNFKEATIKGQGKDKGLFFQKIFQNLVQNFCKNLTQSFRRGNCVSSDEGFCRRRNSEAELRKIVAETIAFEIPLKKSDRKHFGFRTFSRVTLAFKDVGARFMSRCLGYF
jgi:threonine synthase